MTVDVQYAQLIGLALRPLCGQCRGELRRLLLTAQLLELTPQRFDFWHPIQSQQNSQLTGLMGA